MKKLTITFCDCFPNNNLICLPQFNNKTKYQISYKLDDALDFINHFSNLFDEQMTWKYIDDNKAIICTTKVQLLEFCKYIGVNLDDVEVELNSLQANFTDFLLDENLIYEKVTKKRIRKCQQWIAEQVGLAWYDIKIDDEFKTVNFEFNNENYSLMV